MMKVLNTGSSATPPGSQDQPTVCMLTHTELIFPVMLHLNDEKPFVPTVKMQLLGVLWSSSQLCLLSNPTLTPNLRSLVASDQ